jgi:hypothetical protein
MARETVIFETPSARAMSAKVVGIGLVLSQEFSKPLIVHHSRIIIELVQLWYRCFFKLHQLSQARTQEAYCLSRPQAASQKGC